MGLLNNILSKFLPIRDERMLELGREIERLKAENEQLRESSIKVNTNKVLWWKYRRYNNRYYKKSQKWNMYCYGIFYFWYFNRWTI